MTKSDIPKLVEWLMDEGRFREPRTSIPYSVQEAFYGEETQGIRVPSTLKSILTASLEAFVEANGK